MMFTQWLIEGEEEGWLRTEAAIYRARLKRPQVEHRGGGKQIHTNVIYGRTF